MASKMAKAAMTGAHTAGIFADMTVDGPDIGTLVVIVDRAKNLPNRKTMGKQDPYCAARLGKDAKKTETDRRGGQTPRWDQELRFTVHDSPDYHQLKVSVFNDDKKTDLIGETWIPLSSVVVPGGGKNDLWHNLNCKGRYAGEIRIELTYYDTRPKEEKFGESPGATSAPGSQERGVENVSGPRQPKSVKRRPLPTDPISASSSPLQPIMPDHSHSSPMPYSPSDLYQSANRNARPSAYGSMEYDGQMDHQSLQNGHVGPTAPPTHSSYGVQRYDENQYRSQSPDLGLSGHHGQHFAPESSHRMTEAGSSFQGQMRDQLGFGNRMPYPAEFQNDQNEFPNMSPHQNQPIHLPELPPYQPRLARLTAQSSPLQSVEGNSHSNPATFFPQYQSRRDVRQNRLSQLEDLRYQRSPSAKNEKHQENFLPQQPSETDYVPPALPELDSDEGPPPPPPVHRSSAVATPEHTERQDYRQTYPPLSAPAPLNIRNGRGSAAVSPLSQNYSNVQRDREALSASPINTQLSTMSAPLPSLPTSYIPYAPPGRRSSQDPDFCLSNQQYSPIPPPSLVPGYDPGMAEAESERLQSEQRRSMYITHFQSSPLGNDQSPIEDRRHSVPSTQRDPYATPIRNEISKEVTVGRASAPIIKPRAVSPDPRTPLRKSVSPHPESGPAAQVLHGTPFSPDSYDTFNPNLSSASSINKAGPRYETPEQIREAARERQLEEKIQEGPIIGADGREIDPSDHLPTETWAPEPERKVRKGPEITFRFRQSPRGAQPMPDSSPRPPRETVIRPHSISTVQTINHSMDSNLPTSTGNRNRLQKRARGSPTHANSSPVLPTNSSTPASTYPLREHINYGYGSSPGYQRSSPIALPPPVPAKIPLPIGQEDWGRDALSEEIGRIDIGSGSGAGRTRRTQYRP